MAAFKSSPWRDAAGSLAKFSMPLTRQHEAPDPTLPSGRPQQRRSTPSGAPEQRSVCGLLVLLRKGHLEAATITWGEEASLRGWARADARKRRDAVRRLVVRGDLRNARREMREHNKKLSVRLLALFAAARRNRQSTRGMTTSEREAVRLKRLEDVFSALSEAKSFAHSARGTRLFRAKPNGGVRSLTHFHWVDDARLRVLCAALTSFADLHGSQFLLGRDGHRGPAAVREALLQTLQGLGEDHVFLQFDVKNFFGSISHGWLEDYLPFDKGTVRRFVHTGDMLIQTLQERRGGRWSNADASNENGRSGFGIPQGSALSSLVAEMVMADVLRSIAGSEALRLFTWSDNLGVLALRSEAPAVMEHVCAAFEQHGAGPFQLSVEQTPITSEFKYLGVWYQVSDGQPRAFIPDTVAQGWANNVLSDLLTASLEDLRRMEQRVRGHEAAWGWWNGMSSLSAEMRSLIGLAREAPKSTSCSSTRRAA